MHWFGQHSSMFNCMLTQIVIYYQLITWQKLNVFRHLDVMKTTCWSLNRASEWGWNGTLSVAWLTGLSISKTADIRVFREWSEKEKISSERQMCGRKCLVGVRGQRRMSRLVRTTVTQITTRYNQAMPYTISTHQTLKQMGYSSRTTHRVPAKSRKLRLHFTRAHQNWTIEDWKNLA